MSRPLQYIPDEIPESVKQREIENGHQGRRGLPKPPVYPCYKASEPIIVDGKLDEQAWQKAVWMAPFVDMEKGTSVEYDTRVAFLWDDTSFYAGFKLEEPDIFGFETTRDGRVSADGELELFILGDGVYYELQLNTLNTVYEVFWTWFQPLAEAEKLDRLDGLFKTRRAIYGNLEDDYPGRHGSFDWDFPGLQTAIQIEGSLNCRPIEDQGWTAEIALPWSGWTDLVHSDRALPPRNGDTWRMGCSRVQHWRDDQSLVTRSRDWSICQHGKVQMHVPDRWPYVVFNEQTIDTAINGG